ncbi:MAG TPA: serine/threonine-protein kinase [Polyangium sp.]|nr:serine/threonine-protein kinase [Polyangium sp.]
MPPVQEGQYLTSTLKLVRCLGSGAMGEVWTAEDIGLRRRVAVKVMTPGYANDAVSKQRFHKEAQAAGRIQSPYIATIFGHGVSDDGQPFITMELLNGETLRQRVERLGPLPIEEVVRLFEQMAKGIAAAHRHSVIHRDIKPANLFVIDDGGAPFIKVLDFGIAKQLDATTELTSTSAIMGTAAYMSPEQFHDTKRVDHRTDLWSLGVVVYEVLTGKMPFSGPSFWAIGLSVIKGEFTPPSALRADLPNEIDTWMSRALSPDIAARFGSAMEMFEALSAAAKLPMAQRPSGAAPKLEYADTEVSLPGKQPTPKSIPTKTAALGDFIKAGGKGPTKATVQKGEEPRIEIFEDAAQGSLALSIGGTPCVALAFDKTGDSLFMAFATGQIIGFALQTNKIKWWLRLNAKPICLDTSQSHFAVGCANGRIHIFDAGSGVEQNIIKTDFASVQTLALEATGQTLAASGESSLITFLRVATGECMHVAKEHTDTVRALAFDARNGLWASGARDSTVRIWDTSFRQIQVLRGGVVQCAAFAADGSYFAAGYTNGSAILWSTRQWEFDKKVAGHKDRINALAFAPGTGVGGVVVTGSDDGTVGVWGIATGRQQQSVAAGQTPVTCVNVSSDGQYVASLSADGTVRIYRWPIRSIAVAPSAKK